MTPETRIGLSDIPAIVRHFSARPTPRERWSVGTEYEKIGVRADSLAPLSYGAPGGVRDVLEHLQREFGWSPVDEDGHLIALERGRATVTLEPGGQLEYSGIPLPRLWQTCDEFAMHGAELASASRALGITWLAIGVNPLHTLADIPLMPKRRYEIMYSYLPTCGALAPRMMKQTCSVQANVDFSDEDDGVRKLRTAYGVSPLVTAIFANAPFLEGRATGYRSYRAHIWTDVDAARCGIVPGVFREDFRFADYGEFVLDAPMFFVVRDGRYVDLRGTSFRTYLQDGADGLAATFGDWLLHASTVFPDVRLKQHLELRVADCVPPPYLCSIPALWKGLLYDDGALDAAWSLVRGWSLVERVAAREAVARDALDATIAGRSVLGLARELVAIAREGLRRLGETHRGHGGCDFLEPAEDIVTSGVTPADRLIRAYEAAGGGRAGLLAVVEQSQAFDDCVRLSTAL